MGNEKEIGSKNFAPVIRLIDSLTRQGYPPSQIIEFLFLSTLITASEVFPADAIKNLWDKAVTLYEQRRQTAAQEYNDDLHLNAIFLEAEKPFHVAIEHLKSLGFSAHTITAFFVSASFLYILSSTRS